MTRLDWEKANRYEKVGKRRRPKGKRQKLDRQIIMASFVQKHGIACFICGRDQVFEWAKTGTSKKGTWAICGRCVAKKR